MKSHTQRILGATVAAVLLLSSCASLRELGLVVERPTARVESVSVTRLDFEGAGLVTRVIVENPNAVGITLAGFDYELEVEGEPFLSGERDRTLAIDAFDEAVVELPLDLAFEDLFAAYENARDQEELAYRVRLNLSFDLPMIGAVTLPLQQEGTVPVVRPPRLRVASLTVESMSITAASLELRIQVENPNGFAMTLESLDYTFAVRDRVWASGASDRPQTVPANNTGELTTQFSLSFASFGRTVRDLLLGADELTYQLSASAVVSTDLPMVPTVTLPYTRDGRIDLER